MIPSNCFHGRHNLAEVRLALIAQFGTPFLFPHILRRFCIANYFDTKCMIQIDVRGFGIANRQNRANYTAMCILMDDASISSGLKAGTLRIQVVHILRSWLSDEIAPVCGGTRHPDRDPAKAVIVFRIRIVEIVAEDGRG